MKDIVNRIINIGKKCWSYGVKELITSSIFIKNQFKRKSLRESLRESLDKLITYYVMSAKEITSSSSVTTTFDSSDEVKHNNSIDYNNNVVSHEEVIEKDSHFLPIFRVKNVNRLIIGNLNIN